MKRSFTYLTFFFAISSFTYGQSADTLKNKTSKAAEINVSAINTQLLSGKFYGINWNIKYFPTKRFATGAFIVFSQKKISDTFSFSIEKPIIYYYEIGWANQFDLLKTDRTQINISLVNALSVSRLGDNAHKERIHKNSAKEIATNYFYAFEPGGGFGIKLFSAGQNGDIWLTAETNYRFVAGKSKYAATKQFSGYLFSLGISVIGFPDN
ncbi:MAG: hypothetical protein ACHQF0_12290 [Chitinophagales bacterium]